MIRFSLIVSLVLTVFPAFGQTVSLEHELIEQRKPFYVPDTVVMQTAGYLGALSVGAGYQVTSRYSLDIGFGYTPKSLGGKAIRSISVKNSFDLLPWVTQSAPEWSFNLGLGALFGLDRDLFFILPKQYPRYYYPPTALRGLLFGSFGYTFDSGVLCYLEWSLHDSEIAGYVRSPYANPDDIGSYGIGVRWPLSSI